MESTGDLLEVSPAAPTPDPAPTKPRFGATVGDRLWIVRWWSYVSQKEFAAAFGIHPSTLRRYESHDGRPPAELIERVSRALNLGDFLTAVDAPIPTAAERESFRLAWNLAHVTRDQSSRLLCLIDEIQEHLAARRRAQRRSVAGRAGVGFQSTNLPSNVPPRSG